MKNFETIRKTCETSSSISKTVIDEFLLYYAAALYKLDRTMTEAFSAYRHVTKKFEKEWVNRLKAQYLAHKIFKSGGLILPDINAGEQRIFKNLLPKLV